MKIAIDNNKESQADSHRGIGVHTTELLKRLGNIQNLKLDLVPRGQSLDTYDMVHYQKFSPYKISIPFKKSIKSVITIHDLIPVIYPHEYPAGIKGSIIYMFQKIIVKKFDAIITISETSKKDICRFMNIKPEKIFVTRLAANDCFKKVEDNKILGQVKKKYNLFDNFVLYVGDVNYNKNILGLCKAVKIAKTKLVLVGKQLLDEEVNLDHPENRSFKIFLKNYANDPDILRLGYVEDEELNLIYNLASLYCQPSFYEGFGLPILQAFAAKCPVVATKINAHVEIGDDACLYCDAKNPNDIAQKIKEVLESEKKKEELIEKGNKRIREFSWEKTAKETYEVYKKVLNI